MNSCSPDQLRDVGHGQDQMSLSMKAVVVVVVVVAVVVIVVVVVIALLCMFERTAAVSSVGTQKVACTV